MRARTFRTERDVERYLAGLEEGGRYALVDTQISDEGGRLPYRVTTKRQMMTAAAEPGPDNSGETRMTVTCTAAGGRSPS
jgi:hypothetical protein